MSNLLSLIKVNLIETLDTRKMKENKGKTISFLSFILLIGLLFIGISSLYSYIYISLFNEFNADYIYIIYLFTGVTSILVLFTSITRSKALFISKDFDMLSSMPIKKSEIIISKILTMYLIETIYSAILMIPNGVILSIYTSNILYLLSSLVLTILIPALPIVIGTLFGLIVTLFFEKYKYGNIISLILYLLYFVGIFFITFQINNTSTDEETLKTFINMGNIFSYFNPTIILVGLSYSLNPLFYLLFILSNIILSAIGIFILAFFFDKARIIASSTVSNNKYIRKTLENKGEFKNLFFHEIKRYFSSKIYCINTISSGVVSLIFVITLSFTLNNLKASLDVETLSILYNFSPLFVLVIFFGIGIATPASVSISIEGKNMWLIKSSPIDYKKLYQAKLLLSISILSVFSIISSILLIIFLEMGIIASIFVIIAPIIYIVLVSIIGFRINLTNYKLNWTNEQEVVKNSSAVLISMLASIGLTILLAGSIPLALISIYFSMVYIILIPLILSIILYNTTKNKLDYFFNKIEINE